MTLTVLAAAFAVRSARSEALSVFARQEAGKTTRIPLDGGGVEPWLSER